MPVVVFAVGVIVSIGFHLYRPCHTSSSIRPMIAKKVTKNYYSRENHIRNIIPGADYILLNHPALWLCRIIASFSYRKKVLNKYMHKINHFIYFPIL